tara:strand:+ start:3 stop:1106 length:1104 start_codon:yes stop_codon:yes gene_type:complete
MLKKQKKTNKSTINRDTLLIVQVVVLILLIFLIIKQVDTFKNNKKQNIETFNTGNDDSVVLLTEDSNKIKIGNLDEILTNENKERLTSNYSLSTLSKMYVYNNSGKKTLDFYKNKSISQIQIKDGYSVILYEGSNFDNDKRSILIMHGVDSIIDLNLHNFNKILSSIKVFRTAHLTDVIEREASYNNQILLFNKRNDDGAHGEITKIPLRDKMDGTYLRINYYDINKELQNSIKHICIPGPDEIGTYNGTFRNINLKLKSTGIDNAVEIQKSKSITESISFDEYNINPLVPTLDTKTAIEVINSNMVNLESLKSEFNKAIGDQIEQTKVGKLDDNTNKLTNDLSKSFMKKFIKTQHKFNNKIHNFKL